MKLIVGLGNPGPRYKRTRHNMGFCVLEELAKRHGLKFKKKIFSNANECIINISGNTTVLVQPLSFMNLSGNVVVKYAKKYRIENERMLIVYDDIDTPLGSVRLRLKGSSGGHNGMASVIDNLKTQDIPRLKVGIGAGIKPAGLSEYVLSEFTKNEFKEAEKAIDKAVSDCEKWIAD